MSHIDLLIKSKRVHPHKAYILPDFESPTILVEDQFDFVDLWLKRHQHNTAVIFWQQARNFYNACKNLPKESRSLTSYYCMLNAAKALLSSKSIVFSEQHGISGKSLDSKTSLSNEIIETKAVGIFISLSSYFGANLINKSVSLKDVFYNIPFIHRAYTVTYRGTQNLFIPIENCHFVRQNGGQESWFCAEVCARQYCKKELFVKQRGWEIDLGEKSCFVIRSTHRFKWQVRGVPKKDRMEKLIRYHQKIRRDIKYIFGSTLLWYYKRNDKVEGNLAWPIPSLVFMAMHRLSELTRYDPDKLNRFFSGQQNWLITEFLNHANNNFIDQIASEITGQLFLAPGLRS